MMRRFDSMDITQLYLVCMSINIENIVARVRLHLLQSS